jgi:TonB family protein
MVIGAMVLGVGACVGIVYYAHPFGLGMAAVATAPLGGPPQAATTTNAAETPVADAATAPLKPAAATRSIVADAAEDTPVANRVSSDMMDAQLAAQSKLSQDIKKPVANDEPEPPSGFSPVSIDGGSNAPGAVFNGKNNVKVVPAASAISAGVASGLLLHKTAPVYPKFARDAHISGAVVLGATITKSGDLADLHIISGPSALRDSALDAARKWRYRPYLLDNKPVEVQTTINVVFSLGQ